MYTLVKAFIIGTLGTAGAYLLDLVFDYSSHEVGEWLITWAAFLVGSYIGLLLSERRASKKSE